MLTRLFNLRLSDGELESWGEAARVEGLSLSAYVRMVVNERLDRREARIEKRENQDKPEAKPGDKSDGWRSRLGVREWVRQVCLKCQRAERVGQKVPEACPFCDALNAPGGGE